jgi:hypothetical protein
MTTQRRTALDDLSWHCGEAYDLAVTRYGCVAKRLENNRPLLASGPDGLREPIWADYAAQPVPRDPAGRP